MESEDGHNVGKSAEYFGVLAELYKVLSEPSMAERWQENKHALVIRHVLLNQKMAFKINENTPILVDFFALRTVPEFESFGDIPVTPNEIRRIGHNFDSPDRFADMILINRVSAHLVDIGNAYLRERTP